MGSWPEASSSGLDAVLTLYGSRPVWGREALPPLPRTPLTPFTPSSKSIQVAASDSVFWCTGRGFCAAGSQRGPHGAWRLAQRIPFDWREGSCGLRWRGRAWSRLCICPGRSDWSCPRSSRLVGARDPQWAWLCPTGGTPPVVHWGLRLICTLDFRISFPLSRLRTQSIPRPLQARPQVLSGSSPVLPVSASRP